ncbi:MAG TPA: MFS transporter [Pirellulales bacterium]|jgi:nucleoside transporter
MPSVRLRLQLMMFLQYFVWGSWVVSIGGYMGETLHFTGFQISSIFSTTALGAIFAPLFVGYVADRFFATEKILSFLHLVGGGLLLTAATREDFPSLMGIMVGYSACFMPTLALTNSISFQNIGDPEKDFPRIRVFGTLGWIAAGLVVGIVLGGKNNTFFYMAGGSSILLAGLCLLLPHTPPRGAASSDVFGLGALKLFKEPSFTVFAICSFLICIPLSFYYNYANLFLVQVDAPAPTALQVLGQISEVFFMAAMPFFITRLGVKNMLLVGMFAWVARYLCFSTLDFPLILIGLVLHGICYDFFFVASQIYVDKKAPRDMRASAQSLIAFITLGLGMYAGSYASAWVVERYPPVTIVATAADGKPLDKAPLPNWTGKPDESFWRYLDLSATIKEMMQTKKAEATAAGPDFAATADANKNGAIELPEIVDVWIEQPLPGDASKNVTYTGEALRKVFADVDTDSDGSVTRAEWRAAQASAWQKIWIWPAMMAGVTCLIFWLGFHDRVAET